jgi:hypothetical protein
MGVHLLTKVYGHMLDAYVLAQSLCDAYGCTDLMFLVATIGPRLVHNCMHPD